MNETILPTVLTTPARRPRKNALKNLMKRDGIWYFHKFVNGKREFGGRKTPFSLETSDLEVAKAKRDAILRAADGVEVDRVLGRTKKPPAKLSEVFASYRQAPTVRANKATRERNIADLERLVRAVRGSGLNVENASTEILTKQLVKEWQIKRRTELEARAGENLAEIEAGKRALNSTLTHVQSLFSKEARDDYGALYLPPNIKEFADALPVAARKQDEPEPLTDQLVQELMAAAGQLREGQPAAWAAFQLMTWGGLRNKECLFAREDWLEELPAGYRLKMKATDDFLPKGNSRAVILPRAIGLELLAGVATGPQPPAPEEGQPAAKRHLVPAKTTTERKEAIYRRLNDWLRGQGVKIEACKMAYRLRKYFLKKVQEQQGLMMAQFAGGHSSARTTIDHYVGKPKMTEPIKMPAN